MKIFAKMCIAYGRDFDEARAIVYLDAIKNFDEKKIEEAIKKCIFECKFFPTISEIISGMSDGLDAGESWTRVLRCAQYGGRGYDDLSEHERGTLKAIGGLREIQDATEESLHFICQNYLKEFPIISKHIIQRQSLPETIHPTLLPVINAIGTKIQ